MSLLRDWGKALSSYVAMTYPAHHFVLGSEICLIGLHFADPVVFAALPTAVLRWHTLFVLPVVLFPTLSAFLRELPNAFVAIVAMVVTASLSQAPVVAFLIAIVAVFTAVTEQSGTFGRIFANSTFGVATYFFSLHFSSVYVPLVYAVCLVGTVLAVLSGTETENFHAKLVRNFGFVAFDCVYRAFGPTDCGVFGGLAAVFIHQYIGFLMQEYKVALKRGKKTE
jgi:hypothetical protein